MQTSSASPNSRLLRAALLGNAAFSIGSGAALVAFSPAVASVLGPGVSPALLFAIGVTLLGFGSFAAWLGSRSRPSPLIALGVSLADLGWVGGTALGLPFVQNQLSAAGCLLAIAVALAVLGFALGQLAGIARVYAIRADASHFRICLEVETDGDADLIWREIANFGGIARFAPMLAFSRLRDDAAPAVGVIRECADQGKRRWSERCTVLDHERRDFEVEFLAREPDFPFPFAGLKGGWTVRPAAAGAMVRIWWEGTLKNRILAPVIPPFFAWQAQRQFPPMIQRMAGSGISAATGSRILAVIPC